MNKYDIVFESDRIYFIRLTEDLVQEYLDMVNDDEVQRCINNSKKIEFTKEQELEWINEKINNNSVIFSMIEKNTNNYIGNIEILHIKDGVGELGIAITPIQQNKHFGQESIQKIIDYAFDILKLKEIFLKVYDFNQKGVKCYEKVGFKRYKYDEETNDIYMKIMKRR